jgi:hypothetical protein
MEQGRGSFVICDFYHCNFRNHAQINFRGYENNRFNSD